MAIRKSLYDFREAINFREAVKGTVKSLGEHPLIGPRYPRAIPDFKIYAHGLQSDSMRSASIISGNLT
jgi:plasmid stabilization system protein ParE